MKHFLLSSVACVLAYISCVSSNYIRQQQTGRKQGLSNEFSSVLNVNNQRNKVLLNLLLEDLLNKNAEEAELDAVQDILNKNDFNKAEELNDLELAVEDEGGEWLSDAIDLESQLPANYHNVTDVRTKIGKENIDIKESVDKITDGRGSSILVSKVIDALPVKKSSKTGCSLSQPCPDEQYCLQSDYSSTCLDCQPLGSGCLDDAQCCSDGNFFSRCVSGVCKIGVKPGSVGTICKSPDDCDESLCCAHVVDFPRPVCQRFSRLNERCSPTDLDYVSAGFKKPTYFCPCDAGLSCTAKMATFYDLIALKHNENYICAQADSNDSANSEVEVDAPLSDKQFVNLYNRLWRTRAETINDQEYAGNSPPQHSMKELSERRNM